MHDAHITIVKSLVLYNGGNSFISWKPFDNVSLVVKEFISNHSFNGNFFSSKKRQKNYRLKKNDLEVLNHKMLKENIKFFKIPINGFQCVVRNIFKWLKIYISYLVYSQIFLNLLKDDSHFFSIFLWMINHFGYKQKFIK
jgi:hypothetical protein